MEAGSNTGLELGFRLRVLFADRLFGSWSQRLERHPLRVGLYFVDEWSEGLVVFPERGRVISRS